MSLIVVVSPWPGRVVHASEKIGSRRFVVPGFDAPKTLRRLRDEDSAVAAAPPIAMTRAMAGSILGGTVGALLGGLIGASGTREPALTAVTPPPNALLGPLPQELRQRREVDPSMMPRRVGKRWRVGDRYFATQRDAIKFVEAMSKPAATVEGFALLPDLVQMTGTEEGAEPYWAYALAVLTEVWLDPHIVMHAMVRDQAVYLRVNELGMLMTQALGADGSFAFGPAADSVREVMTR